MIYTMKNAGMTLSSAQNIMLMPETWDKSQVARAKVVVAHWARIRANQPNNKGIK